MKFCEKLVKLRKNNNMSQEQLADRLGVSRQAVSKWESGISMPDMEKIMQLCKILNCSLDDLVDDAACGNKDNRNVDQKINIHTYLDEILGFITKTLNMFWSMRFVEKVKCILEMLFIIFIMLIIWMIVGNVINSIFNGILYMLPNSVYRIISQICKIIYSIFGIFVGSILFIHIFKIRYLDYFVTIEDESSTSKSVEAPVDMVEDKDKKVQFTSKKNKIIIRDPKHSTYSFFNILAHMIVWFIKFILLFVAFFAIISFIFLIFGMTISLWYVKDGIFFLGISIILIGCILINYIILEVIYKFILNISQMYRKIFFCFIIGLILSGVGAGISTLAYETFSNDDNSYVKYETKSFNIDDVTDDVVISFIKYYNVSLIKDDSCSSISIEFTYNEDGIVDFYNYIDYTDGYADDEYTEIKYDVYDYNYYNDKYNVIDSFNSIITLLSEKKKIDNYYIDTVSKIVIKGNSSDIDKLLKNYSKYNG